MPFLKILIQFRKLKEMLDRLDNESGGKLNARNMLENNK